MQIGATSTRICSRTQRLLIAIMVFMLLLYQTPGWFNQTLCQNELDPVKINHTKIQEMEPSMEYERTRRLVEQNQMESWYFISDQLRQLQSEAKKSFASSRIGQIKKDIDDHFRVTRHDLLRMSKVDGYQKWRERESKALSALIQRRLHTIQNPKNCTAAKKILCDMSMMCGAGCQIHHLVYCFLASYSMKRTLILNSKDWRYAKKGWEAVFKPLSDTCNSTQNAKIVKWPGTSDDQVILFPNWDKPEPRPDYLPLGIPKDIANRLIRFHGEPAAWWIGQFMKYLFRMSSALEKIVANLKVSLKFQNPIVGLHIRRSDKLLREAKYHPVEEYMTHVEEFYNALQLQQQVDTRRVYLASDELKVITELVEKYPNYTFLYNVHSTERAGLKKRYSLNSLRYVMADIYLLSRTDHLVCTFSSNIGRLAYELMQTLHQDASGYFRSLDAGYYYHFQSPHLQETRYSHTPRRKDEISLQKGDIVEGGDGIMFTLNNHNGFSYGSNARTMKKGLYPGYKMQEIFHIVNASSYDYIDQTSI